MYAVLFASRLTPSWSDANGYVVVLLDREQAIATRETIDEIVTELEW
ncbi:hypothetical protein [Halorubrum salipaludis]|nr:hypothetical protein [Halorubrum salipaludis]